MITALLRSARMILALLSRTIQLYASAFRLLVGITACLVVPFTLVLLLSGFVPTLYSILTMVQSAFIQFLVTLALIPAIALTVHKQPVTIAGAYRVGLFRFGVTAVAGGLLGFLVLVPGILLLANLVDPTTSRLPTPTNTPAILQILAIAGLVIIYCTVSFLLFPVAVLNRGGPEEVIVQVFTLVLRHGGVGFILFLVTTLLTTLPATMSVYFLHWGWTVLIHPTLLPLGATSRWIEWAVFVTIQQALLILTLPVQSIVGTIWYLDVRTLTS